MHSSVLEQRLERNLWVYGLMKIFTKRVFLPLVAIYLVEVGKLSVGQVAILATISPLVSLLAEVPTGYFADRITRKASLFTSAFVLVLMSVALAVYPHFWGALLATLFESIGYAFLNGAGEALIHDTLAAQKRTHDYSKIVARAQSIGLFGNMILLSTVGLTYKLNPRLPFIISIFAYLTLFGLISLLYEPMREYQEVHSNPVLDLFRNLKSFVTRRSFLFFMSVGVMTGIYFGVADFNNLIFKDLGMPTNLLGIVYAGSSLLAVGLSIGAAWLRRLPLFAYMMLDMVASLGVTLGIGLTHNLTFMIVASIINASFFRLRNIVYQHHLLDGFPLVRHKATLLSVLAFFGDLNELWVPALFGAVIVKAGYYKAYSINSAVLLLIMIPLALIAVKLFATLASNGRRQEA